MKVLYYKIVPIDSFFFFFFLKVPLEVDYFIRTRMTEPYKFMKGNDHTSRLPKTYKFKTHLFLKKKKKKKKKGSKPTCVLSFTFTYTAASEDPSQL